MRHPLDERPSPSRYTTRWRDDSLTFELEVRKLGVLIVRTTTNLADPQGKIVPAGLSIRGPLGDRGDGSE